MEVAISVHRRDSDGPEALGRALASGAEYAELDVRRTADGELVVKHDSHVAGLPLARCTYDRAAELLGRPPLRLAEAMRLVAGRAHVHLDLKERGCEHEAVALAQDILGPDSCVVTTKEARSIALITKDFPEVRTALSVGRGPWERGAVRDFAPLRQVRECGAHMVAVNHWLARLGVLRQCARAGVPAIVWTVNAEPLMRRFLCDPRVAVVVTDHPRRALALRAAR